TRLSLVAKKWTFSHKNDDENEFRRQNCGVFTSKWRRELVSSPKLSGFHFKMATRTGFVAKKSSFSPQNGDENRARHQKVEFFAQK
ncbi:hypothetical protein, partial [Caldibacillus thermoamylovorans]|uniref:hypothetical protein n=1 Tax=Caldibacillus thermoamylovorans TaxID=35841 RepID=UPI0022E83368